jgi:glycosyltransferase involved in cell wall biosynthesis
LINNGINISDFKWNCREKIKNKFIWSSCAYRGLHLILNLWDKVLEKIPDATLDICSYEIFPKNSEETEMKQIIDKHESIVHHGKLDTNALYELASKCEYWLYTNTFPETSCITAMEMLMSEVVCLYYPLAGLNDTIGEYGIAVKQGEENYSKFIN